jgi:hypothetical protein
LKRGKFYFPFILAKVRKDFCGKKLEEWKKIEKEVSILIDKVF